MLDYSKSVNRILDANLNRMKEGLRVCEEVSRFVLESRTLTLGFKKARHQLDSIAEGLPCRLDLQAARRSRSDIGKKIYVHELKRDNLQDIFFANIQRAKESIRVLEEFSKLKDTRQAVRFKELRFVIYDLEKKATKRLMSLNHR